MKECKYVKSKFAYFRLLRCCLWRLVHHEGEPWDFFWWCCFSLYSSRSRSNRFRLSRGYGPGDVGDGEKGMSHIFLRSILRQFAGRVLLQSRWRCCSVEKMSSSRLCFLWRFLTGRRYDCRIFLILKALARIPLGFELVKQVNARPHAKEAHCKDQAC